MKVDRNPTKPISRGKSKTQEAPPTHKAVTPKPHEKKTESKQAETALHSAEEDYRSIFEQAPLGIFQSTPQGCFRNVNSAMAQIYGYDSPEQMITEITSISDQVYVNSSTRQEFQRVLAERGEIHNSLDEHYRKDGSHIWTQTTARAIKDKDGKVLFYEGFIIDVTERLQEQQQLHESEERFRALIENASDMILTITADGNLNYVSPAALRITGYQADEVIGRNIVEFIHADDLPLALQALASRSKISGLAPDPIELRFHHKDGMWRIVEILGNNLLKYPAVKGIVLNVRDITDRKQAEAAVRESEDRYRDLVENSQDLICTHDLNGQILSANPRAEKMLGYEHTALLQMNFRDILAPEALPGLTAYLRRITKRGADQGQMIVQTKTGERRIWEYNNTLRTEGVSTPIVRGMARDITERKQAEETLRLRASYLAAIIENQPGLVWLKDADCRFLTVNQAFADSCGKASPAELMGKTDFDIWPKELAEKYRGDDVRVMKNKIPTMVEEPIADRGETKWFETFKTPVLDDRGQVIGTTGYSRDITERKRAEEDLRASQLIIEGIINAIPMRVFWKDKNLVYLGCNAAFAHDAGFTDSKDVIGKDDYQMGWRDQAELYRGDDRQVIESGSSKLNVEEPQTTPEGNIITLLTSKVPLRNSKEETIGVLGMYMDITERKRAEEAVRDSEKHFRALIENSSDAITLLDAKGIAIYDSPASPGMLGYAPEDWIGRDVFALIHPDDLPKSRDLFQHLGETPGDRVTLTFRVRHKSGSWLWIEMVATNLLAEPSVQAIVLNYRDITDRKQAEETLQETQAHLRAVLNNVPITIFATDSHGVFTLSEGKGLEHVGLKPSENVGTSALDLYGSLPFVERAGKATTGMDVIRRVLAGETVTAFNELRGVYFENHISPLLGMDGKVVGIVGIAIDVTERKQAEEEIKSQLEELERWQDVMLGRGDREQKLKREVNELCRRVGESARYPSQEIGAEDSETAPAKL